MSLESKPPSIFEKPFEETHGRAPNPFLLAPLLATSKPVQRKDFIHDEEARNAYWKEWNNLESKEVWKWDTLCEWDDVSSEARAKGEEIHFGYLFGFMVVKGDEYPKGDPRRRWKY